jgi:hypothetical protein
MSPTFRAGSLRLGLAFLVLAASALGTDLLNVTVGMPALLLAWVTARGGALAAAVRSAMRKDRRQCLIALLLPIVLLVAALDPVRFVRACNHNGEVAHFIPAKRLYDRQIGALPASGGPRFGGVRLGRIANPPMGWNGRAIAN